MVAVLDHPLSWETTIEGVDSVRLPAGPERNGKHLPVVVFDGDDTLWATEHLYDEARRKAAKAVAEIGLDPDEWERLQVKVDLANVARFGLAAERFPTSSVDACLALAARYGIETTADDIDRVRIAAGSVFDEIAPIAPAAGVVLAQLRPTHRLILLTQGDPRVQRKRIVDSELGSIFDEVVIVARKSPAVLAALIDHFGIPHDESWMVGNSLPSDINPALGAGMRAIWIDAHVWDHERREPLLESDRVVVAADLSQVPAIVADTTA